MFDFDVVTGPTKPTRPAQPATPPAAPALGSLPPSAAPAAMRDDSRDSPRRAADPARTRP
jgi:hypothetical protein